MCFATIQFKLVWFRKSYIYWAPTVCQALPAKMSSANRPSHPPTPRSKPKEEALFPFIEV